ncbi:MAG: hypothetical protein MHPSP_002111 [Paramarteilia canceri]
MLTLDGPKLRSNSSKRLPLRPKNGKQENQERFTRGNIKTTLKTKQSSNKTALSDNKLKSLKEDRGSHLPSTNAIVSGRGASVSPVLTNSGQCDTLENKRIGVLPSEVPSSLMMTELLERHSKLEASEQTHKRIQSTFKAIHQGIYIYY